MLALLKKEFIVNLRIILISTAVYILINIVMYENQFSLYLTIPFVLLVLGNSDGMDELNHSERLIASLPVSRDEVVMSKVIFGSLIGFFYILIISSLNFILPNLEANQIGEFIASFILIIFSIVVYQLLFLLFGSRVMKYIIILIYLAFITIIPMIVNTRQYEHLYSLLNNFDLNLILSALAIIFLILAALILRINLKLYQAKDL
ncbi:ABC-2 transporter permease [Fundicoccus culcitae]|uniref:ABC-2 transporter permease n=1 Tax=Fundicoccus culcitae TaxID=2969821 RepID=A0ABY5P8N0_9LACT|nr:ABC-2 transporter permease [Fundicoccus culcitae]UUX34725.1 ABC-2 transporter permease [Fundicoccus culcitae]